MTLRRIAIPPLLALAAFACTPSVPSNPNTAVNTAQWDPSSGVIPLPNDLAINPQLNPGLLAPANAQDELLAYFYAQQGFPPDQVTPLQFPMVLQTVNGPNDVAVSPPDLDPATFVPCTAPHTPANCNILVVNAAAPLGTPFPTLAMSYAAPAGAPMGTLTATPTSGGAPTTWTPGGAYVYAIRGGANGVKTRSGASLQPSSSMYTLLFGGPNDFQCPSTVPPLECPLLQLGVLKSQYASAGVFTAIQAFGFPLADTVVMGTFRVAPATTWVVADPATGVVPVPSDFLLDPTTHKVSQAAADAFGIPALTTLDGFSTTGMDIAQTSGPVLASTVRSSADQGVYLYKLSGGGATQVSTVYVQPPPITLDPSTGHACVPVNPQGDFGPTCVTDVLGIQPALALPTAGGPVALPPLEESTTYAVLVTDKVKDAAGDALSKTTLGQILLFQNPLCTPSPACVQNPTAAVSQLPGVSGPEAAGLEAMRLQLQPAVAALAGDHGVASSSVTMAYTFRTQSFTQVALQLGSAPYAKDQSGADLFPDAPVAAVPVTSAAMAAKWGVPPELLAAGISTFVEATVLTFDKLDPASGAFFPDPVAGTPTPIPAIVAIPAGTPPATGWPLVVFHHGLGRSRGDVLLIAQALAGNGMVVAAIDSAKHGARAWCSMNTVTGVASGCATGVTCDTTVFAQQPTDPPTARPGLCQGALQTVPIACDPTVTPTCWDGTGGNSVTSGAFLISSNLFRSRDSTRQDILDQSMLVRVLTTANGMTALSGAAGSPVVVDPTKVFYVGQSLGSLDGTTDLAANPRFSRAVLNVGGATIIDVLTTSPSLSGAFLQVLESIGITPGTKEYLLFTIGAKWILDPAEPANFASHVTLDPLPNLLQGGTQAPKVILGQGARCDLVVPNPTNELLYGLVGVGPLDPTAAAATPTLQWYMASSGGTCPTDGTTGPGVPHGFLLDWSNPPLATAAQQSAVSFLLGGPVAPTPVVVPAP